MGMNMGDNFASECNSEWCCEGNRCVTDMKGFIDPSMYGKEIAGCVPNSTPNPPPNTIWVGPSSDPAMCSQYNVLGGCATDSFFDNDPNTEYTFAFVVDKRGVYSYRWLSKLSMWPGIEKYTAASTLTANRPAQRPTKTSPPCLESDEFCLLYHPSSLGERGCVTAGGDPSFLQGMGVAVAEGKNWWNWMEDTGGWWDYSSSILNKRFQDNKEPDSMK